MYVCAYVISECYTSKSKNSNDIFCCCCCCSKGKKRPTNSCKSLGNLCLPSALVLVLVFVSLWYLFRCRLLNVGFFHIVKYQFEKSPRWVNSDSVRLIACNINSWQLLANVTTMHKTRMVYVLSVWMKHWRQSEARKKRTENKMKKEKHHHQTTIRYNTIYTYILVELKENDDFV